MKRSNSDDFLMTAIIMAEAHGNCCSDNALYKNRLLLFIYYYIYHVLSLLNILIIILDLHYIILDTTENCPHFAAI